MGIYVNPARANGTGGEHEHFGKAYNLMVSFFVIKFGYVSTYKTVYGILGAAKIGTGGRYYAGYCREVVQG
jgi:hypothetical protein